MMKPNNNPTSIKVAALIAIKISVFLFAAATLARSWSILLRSRSTS